MASIFADVIDLFATQVLYDGHGVFAGRLCVNSGLFFSGTLTGDLLYIAISIPVFIVLWCLYYKSVSCLPIEVGQPSVLGEALLACTRNKIECFVYQYLG